MSLLTKLVSRKRNY